MPLFLDYFNRQHPNISFTSELEKDGKLPFLDIEILRSNGKFSTSVYRKPTFTGLFTSFHSFIPLAYKRSLVSCLLHRICNLCSSYENFHAQLEVVRKLFNLFYFILHVCHYKSTNTIYNYTAMMSHKDYINISHKYYDGWNDHTEIKSPITGFHKIH